MITLSNPQTTLEVLLAAAPNVQLPLIADVVDFPPGPMPTLTKVPIFGLTKGTNPAPLAPPPAAGLNRCVRGFNIPNVSNATQTITIRINSASTLYPLWTKTLLTGERWEWVMGKTTIYDATNAEKVAAS